MVLDNRKVGYISITVGVCLYAFSDAIMKYFMPIYGVNQVTFFRTISRFIPLLIFALYKKENPLSSVRIKENLFRAVLASLGTYLFMLAYRYAAMTDVVVVGYSTAIFVIPFSVFILKEKFYIKEAIAVGFGFAGILLLFRPGCGVFQFGVMYAVLGAVIGALNQVIIKRLTATDNEITIIFYHHIVLIIISLVIGFDSFAYVNKLNHFMLLVTGGLIGAVAQYCIIHAFKLSTCSSLAPATYIMLLPMTLIDFCVYDKIPDLFIIGGLALIIFGNSIGFRK